MSKIVKIKQSDIETIVESIINERRGHHYKDSHSHTEDDFKRDFSNDEYVPNPEDEKDFEDDRNYGVEDLEKEPKHHDEEDIDESIQNTGEKYSVGIGDDGRYYILKVDTGEILGVK
jgi:hypothetical protein